MLSKVIQRDEADAMISGGAEASIGRLALAGFLLQDTFHSQRRTRGHVALLMQDEMVCQGEGRM